MRPESVAEPSTTGWRSNVAEPSVGRGNVRCRMIRLRRGSVAAAWTRIGRRRRPGIAEAIDMVTIRPAEPPEVTLVAGQISRAVVDEHRIELATDQSPFDLAFAYAHELGHLFDATMLDDEHRAVFAEAVGTDHRWTGGRYCDNVEEAWASAFAVVACTGPWRCRLWAPSNWPAERTLQVIATCRRLIAAATPVGALGHPGPCQRLR